MADFVELCEVGPRDGFQFEATPIPTAFKLRVIRGLMAAGVRRIQATSFVHPKWVPQMADAEVVLEALLPEASQYGTTLTALALNVKGVERAVAAGVGTVDLSIALNEQHAKDNANMSVQQGIDAAHAMLDAAAQAGVAAQLGLQTVWGYQEPDDTLLARVREVVAAFADRDLESLSLADSTGMASPVTIKRTVEAVRAAAPGVDLVLHLHDTRGLGMANVAAAIEAGVRRFDTSLGGLGGCPFIPGATGNIATEDTAYLVGRLGLRHGLDVPGVAAISRAVEDHVGHALSGRMYRLV
ncbi:MAG: hydroxymethylglutaryl-CoA lyase [Rhodothermales bacterium]|nr:hydroxymethylglutaryl-CoA lyase [Rhodothermales bacterium]MBO6779032.1 hydroxymethylglutaryl-CoA lyase [Rhodothermales bacterium]